MTVEPYAAEQRHPVETWSHSYRIALWRQQTETDSWWSEIWDLRAEDVHEVVEWADRKAHAEGANYTLYVRVEDGFSGEDLLVHIAGVNPTHADDTDAFFRRHPRAS